MVDTINHMKRLLTLTTIAVCIIPVFALASLTLNSTTISSDGDLILSPGSGKLIVNGIMELSDAEKAYWQDKAALLDPAAYEFVSGTGWTRTVPSGETWYAVSQYQTNSAGQQPIHQRLGDVDQAIMLPAGTTITPSQNSYLYICKPSLVTGSDSRYATDPKGLYYSRLNSLRSLAINYLYVSVPGTLATGATATADFPTDFTKGLVVGVSVTEASWGGMQYM
jgi:hypothetical protein